LKPRAKKRERESKREREREKRERERVATGSKKIKGRIRKDYGRINIKMAFPAYITNYIHIYIFRNNKKY